MKKKKKNWNDYLWIATISYFALGLFNVVFAWLGMICMAIPLYFAIKDGSKTYCNKYCGRSQLLEILGDRFKLSKRNECPTALKSTAFRYAFLAFFMTMFAMSIATTYFVFKDAQSFRQVITLMWTFKIPFTFNYHGTIPWISQFAYGMYSLMLTSTILGIITMVLFKPRTWCVYCPIGTMTQGICKLKAADIKQQYDKDNRAFD